MVKKSRSGGKVAATRRAAKTPKGNRGIARLRSPSTGRVVAKETPSSLASLLAERVAAAR